ncbi:uncharacterized protein LOC127421942 [Myxocyprinus asiaticus]|uniref:uncharacterized protein LOC127421942 n=1 Tax=Myxocyprinus asiaticus TaxID=70543 RepID=UPI002223D072|nr:uncharacterized protein LOC127421942 [Myxocyprinus asiaticus]
MRGQNYQQFAGYCSIFLLIEFAVLNNGHNSFSTADFHEQNTTNGLKQNERQVITNKESDCLANILKETEVQQCRKLTLLENQQVTLCNSTEEQQLYQFWKSQPLARNLYTLLSAVLYSVSDCPGMAGNRLEEAVNEMGCELVSEILKEVRFLYEELHLVGDLETYCTVWRKPAVLSHTTAIIRELLNGTYSTFITEEELKSSLRRDALIQICSFIKNSPSSRPMDSFIPEPSKQQNSLQYITDSNQGCSHEDEYSQCKVSLKQRDTNNKSGEIEELAFFKRLDMKILNLTRNSVTQFYFLKSTTSCKLLSGDLNTSLPVPKDYDENKLDNFVWHWENEKTFKNNITGTKTRSKQGECVRATSYRESIKELQLWYWSNRQIINLNSGFALELIEIQDKMNSYHIISTSPRDLEDRLVLNQLWTRKSNLIQSIKYPGLFLDVYKKSKVHLSTMPKGNWSFVDFQDDSVVNSCIEFDPTVPSLCPCNNTFEYKSNENYMLKQYHPEEQLWYWQAHHVIIAYHHLIVSAAKQTI